MLNSIKGKIRKAEKTGRIVLSVLDFVTLTLEVPSSANLEENSEVELFVDLVTYEDRPPRLYGFLSEEERDVFTLIRSVSGIGPATALSILSSLGIDGLQTAVASGDSMLLSSVRGIGERKAKILLAALSGAISNIAQTPQKELDAVDALVAIGVAREKAKKAVVSVFDENLEVSEIVRKALRQI